MIYVNMPGRSIREQEITLVDYNGYFVFKLRGNQPKARFLLNLSLL